MITFQRLLLSYSLMLLSCVHTTLFAQDLKGMYVNDFKNILGDSAKEKHLLEFTEAQGFNYLLLYNLRYISDNLYDLTSPNTAATLAQFIQKAKEEYGVVAVGAVGQQFSSFKNIISYNQLWSIDDSRRIDVYHMEFEFWNKNFLQTEWESQDKSLAFKYYIDQMEQLKNICVQQRVKCETYLGNVSIEECNAIKEVADRVILHYYRKSDVYNNGNSIYQYKAYRLPALALSGNKALEIIPVFSARSYAMGPWLEDHDLEQAFETFLFGQNAYAAQEGDWKNNINIVGYSWYRYTDLENILNGNTEAEIVVPNYLVGQEVQLAMNNGNLFGMTQRAIYENQASANLDEINAYPQPADYELRIETAKEIKDIHVFDMTGRAMNFSWSEREAKRIHIMTAEWNAGMYILRIKHTDRTIATHKLLIKH